jgi:hypothetical protein
MTVYLFPSDPLGRGFSVDPQFERMFDLVKEKELDYGFFDYDKFMLTNEVKFRFSAFADLSAGVEYRGWMMLPEEYVMLSIALTEAGGYFLTNPEQFAKAHAADGWTEALEGLIPPTVLVDQFHLDELNERAATLGVDEFFVKDYTKSVPEACHAVGFEGDNGMASVADRLIELREGWFAGGLVIREWKPAVGDTEVRTWWRNGEFKTVTVHPNSSGDDEKQIPEELLNEVSSRLNALGLHFVTVDWMETTDGWKVVEVGDGQVSEPAASVTQDELVSLLGLN